MFVILPLLAFLFIALIASQKSQETEALAQWRESFLFASIVWGVFLTAATEALSLVNSVTLGGLAGAWGLFSVVLAAIWLKGLPHAPRGAPSLPDQGPSRSDVLLLCGLGLIVVPVGLIALVSPPNNWDSMTYHMSRVAHWAQNGTLAFYPTHILRQLFMNPWAESAILHLYILGGGDRFPNLVQWFSMIGSACGVSLIARQFGAARHGQMLAAVMTATIPMGILQGSSTQNDYVVSFWLVCFVYQLRAFKASPNWRGAALVGSSLGLAMLTKATGYLYSLPFLIWFGLSALRSRRRSLWGQSLLVIALAVLINLGHYARNLDVFGHPLGPARIGGQSNYRNDVFGIPEAMSNTIRNVALHLATPSYRLNAVMVQGIRAVHSVLGVDVDDPRTTWPGTRFELEHRITSEDYAGNALHFALILGSVIMFIGMRRVGGSGEIAQYALTLVVAFLLFNVYLKWQPWHSRLHLPLFVLWASFSACVACRLSSQRITALIAAVLILASLPWVVSNKSRPLVGQRSVLKIERMDGYFANRPRLKESYREGTRLITSKGCFTVGLSLGEDEWEYPLWVLLQAEGKRDVRIEHFGVQNQSHQTGTTRVDGAGNPCAVIAVKRGPQPGLSESDGDYTKVWSMDPVEVFMQR